MPKQTQAIKKTVAAIIRLLEKQGQLGQIDRVIAGLARFRSAGRPIVKVISAVALSHKETKEIDRLFTRLGFKDCLVQYSVEPALGAGLMLKINDQVLDLSLKNQINLLKGKINEKN